MGVMNSIMDFMRLNDDDDDFDNEEYDDFDDEDDEERPSLFRRKSKEKEEDEPQIRSSTAPRRTSQPEPVRERPEDRAVVRTQQPAQPQQTKIVPMRRSSNIRRDEKMEVCVIKPTGLEDEREIAETLLQGRAVLINVEGLNVDIAQRIIDFVSGAAFAITGTMQIVSNYIFIAAPQNVDVSGDLPSLLNGMNADASSYTF